MNSGHIASCPARKNKQVYCPVCDKAHQSEIDRNAGSTCFRELLEEHPKFDMLGDVTCNTEQQKSDLRKAAYRIAQCHVAKIYKIRRPLPACVENFVRQTWPKAEGARPFTTFEPISTVPLPCTCNATTAAAQPATTKSRGRGRGRGKAAAPKKA